jgi:hypothetical protein
MPKIFTSLWARRVLGLVAAASLCVLVVACGGGGGGGGGGGLPLGALPSSVGPAPAAPDAATAGSDNILAIVVDGGPPAAPDNVNVPYVSVTVCAPGSSTQCQVIDHVVLDTGSSGLRLLASVLQSRGLLPLQADPGGTPYAECAQFASGYAWGTVRLADVGLGGEKAFSVPVHVIEDPDNPGAVPPGCATSGAAMDSVASLGGNGLLGVGVFREDCGSACVGAPIPNAYYQCDASSGACVSSTIALAQQVANPVALLAKDNNGVLIQLPAIDPGGAINVPGTLALGIGTRSNNGLGGAQVYALSASGGGTFTTVLGDGTSYADSFVDSGSNLLFFGSNSLPVCAAPFDGFYCPVGTQSLSAVNTAINGTSGSISFSVANAVSALSANPSATAFNNLAGSAPVSADFGFDWGLPFFFGRNVYTALEGASTPGGTGPYVAY